MKDGILHTAHSFNIWRSIDRLRFDYGVDPALILKGTTAQRGSEISAIDLIKISNNLNVNSKNLLNANLDLDVISHYLKGNKLSIPKRYSNGMFSSSTSLKNTVNQFKRFGMKNFVLNKLQINEEYLDDHRPLSVTAVKDALEAVDGFICEEDLKNYSKANAYDFYHSDFGEYVRKNMTKSNVVDAIMNAVHLVEENWKYEIKSQDSTGEYTIASWQSDKMNNLNSGLIYTTPSINKMRTYFFYYFLEMCGFQDHEVKILTQEFSVQSKMTFSIKV